MAYDPQKRFNVSDMNKLRFQLFFATRDTNLRKLPPSKSALCHHGLRSAYVASWVLGSSLTIDIEYIPGGKTKSLNLILNGVLSRI